MRGKKAKEMRRFLKDGMGIDVLGVNSKGFYRRMKKDEVESIKGVREKERDNEEIGSPRR